MNTEEIAQIRKDYSLQSLDVNDLNPEPIAQFQFWLQESINAQLPEPTAMNLATVGSEGRPSSRIVLLKGIEQGEFIFYTNYLSKKGTEMEQNPFVALNFHWVELERQVRIEGRIRKSDAQTAIQYFQSRPKASQIGAWASAQSTKIESREYLEQQFEQVKTQYQDQELLPKPDHWGGYAVKPYYFEFWQGRRSRLHDRLIFEWNEEKNIWEVSRLAP